MALLSVSCSACTASGSVYWGPYPGAYQLANGETLGIAAAVAWCRNCREVVEGERVPDRATLEHELADVEAHGMGAPALAGMEDPNVLPLYIARLESRLAWIDSRQAPARCLRCGSTELDFFPASEQGEEWPTMAHPGCQGMLRLALHAFVSLSRERPLFSVDGERLVTSPKR